MSILQNSNAISAGGYDINNSLRFRSSASAYLSRTPASNGNRRTWTWSAWVKRGSLGSYQVLFGAGLNNGVNADELVSIYFTNSDQLGHYVNETGVADRNNYSTAVYRDPSAWYHIVAIYDSTQATAANRQRLFVNNVEITSWAATSYVSQNYQPSVNSTAYPHAIGKYGFNNTRYFDGYMTEVNFIDGQALTPSSFGETDTTTGSWKPKAYTGTYGTNGFYLKFSDIATTSGSNAGLGKDFSGNTNYWTTNNISVTSGTTYDAMTDSPTLTSATVANYCVINPLSNLDGHTLSAGNLNISQSSNSCSVFGTLGISSGKYYWEVICSNGVMVGVADTQRSGGTYPGNFANSCAWNTYYALNSTNTYASGTFTKAGTLSGSAGVDNDVIGCALDMDAGTIKYYVNGSVTNSGNAVFTNITGTVFPLFRGSITTTSPVNFGQRPFAYTPPTGYKALNTYNLPDSTIKKGNSYMDATLYTGTGATQVVTNSGSMKPDLVWLKSRGVARDHRLMDTVRGINLGLQSDLTNAEYTGTALSSINSNGFTLNTTDNQNVSSEAYVAWQWQAGQGSTSTNTSGSITSTVSVNTTAGFSVVTYAGNGASGATVGHGLGVAPKMMIVKCRTSGTNSWTSWQVYHASLTTPTTSFLRLNETSAVYTGFASAWNSTAPTSSVFSVSYAGGAGVNGSGDTFVAYCFAEITGFSKFGSYTGNGSADGPFIYTGFRPKFIMIKSTATANAWHMTDTSRSIYNTAVETVWANESSAESTSSTQAIDVLSNGFKIRNSTSEVNNSGTSMIYMAFAENPFKNSNAR